MKKCEDFCKKRTFEYLGKTIIYFVKNIELKEVKGKEMASAIMVVCDENDNQIDFFRIYDERYKIMYAMPEDAKRWYEEYING